MDLQIIPEKEVERVWKLRDLMKERNFKLTVSGRGLATYASALSEKSRMRKVNSAEITCAKFYWSMGNQ